MDRTAKIYIRENEDGEPIFVTEGVIDKIGNSLNLTYPIQNGTYAIGVSDGVVSIRKKGDEDYALILCEGKEYPFDITTPFGTLSMSVLPEFVFVSDSDKEVEIKLIYDLIAAGGKTDTFRLFIKCIYSE